MSSLFSEQAWQLYDIAGDAPRFIWRCVSLHQELAHRRFRHHADQRGLRHRRCSDRFTLMISFRLPNGSEFSFPVEWWNEVGMPAFERQSPYYLWGAVPELFVRLDAIEPPPLDYEELDRVRMVNVLRPSKSRSYRWVIITIDYTTAHIASLRPSLLASRTFPLDCGLNAPHADL